MPSSAPLAGRWLRLAAAIVPALAAAAIVIWLLAGGQAPLPSTGSPGGAGGGVGVLANHPGGVQPPAWARENERWVDACAHEGEARARTMKLPQDEEIRRIWMDAETGVCLANLALISERAPHLLEPSLACMEDEDTAEEIDACARPYEPELERIGVR